MRTMNPVLYDSLLTEEEAQEYARLELASEAHVAITGLSGAASLEYVELTPSQSERLRFLGSPNTLWPDYIHPMEYAENEFEEADRLARIAGYNNARAMGEALKPAWEAAQQEEADRRLVLRQKRSEAAKRAAATRRANSQAQTTEPAPPLPLKVNISAYDNGEWEVQMSQTYTGTSYEAAYYRVIISQLKLARAFEPTIKEDWYAGNTDILDMAIAIWEDRLARATTEPGSEQEREYQYRRAVVADSINADYPDLAATVRSMVAARETPAAILLWFVGTRWAKELTVQAIIMLIDRIWD